MHGPIYEYFKLILSEVQLPRLTRNPNKVCTLNIKEYSFTFPVFKIKNKYDFCVWSNYVNQTHTHIHKCVCVCCIIKNMYYPEKKLA